MRRLFSAYTELKEASAEKSSKYAHATVDKFAWDYDRGNVSEDDFPEYKDLMDYDNLKGLLGLSPKPEYRILLQNTDLLFKAIFRHIQTKIDPAGGKYTLWIVKRYSEHRLNSWEDLYRVKDALTLYRKLHQRRWWNKSEEVKAEVANAMLEDGGFEYTAMHIDAFRNIDHIPSLVALESFIRATGLTHETEGGAYERHKGTGFEEIYSGPEGYVINLKTLEASVELFRGPTAWCTARPGNHYFEHYLDDGPLIVLYDAQAKYYLQWHDTLVQFRYRAGDFMKKKIGHRLMADLEELIIDDWPMQIMDARDEEVSWYDFIRLNGNLRKHLLGYMDMSEAQAHCLFDTPDFVTWCKDVATMEELYELKDDGFIHTLLISLMGGVPIKEIISQRSEEDDA